jgi:hypothetical protein
MKKFIFVSVLVLISVRNRAQEFSIFSNEIPVTFSSDNLYELGTEFRTLAKGSVTKVKLYTALNEGGSHTVRLWRRNGSNYILTSGPFTWNIVAGSSGWHEYTLPAPVPLDSNNVYVIAIGNSADRYYAVTQNFTPLSVNNAISYISGVYTRTIGRAPNRISASSAYFRDIVFVPAAVQGNSSPVITTPTAAQNVNENTSLVFSAANTNLISISDPDNTTGTVSVSVTNGTFTLSGIAGLTFTTGDGTGDANLAFSGLLTSINTALNTANYTPASGYSGPATVTLSLNDGAGGIATGAISIMVGAVNDPPVIIAPSTTQNVNENTSLVFSTANNNLISISDPDNTTGTVSVSVTNGTFTLSGIAGLTFTTGDGTGDANLTFSGLLTSINTALNTANYTPANGYSGPATVTHSVNDGAGGTNAKTVAIQVNSVVIPPDPGQYTLFTTEVPATFSADNLYELGTEFRTNVRGTITKVRLYTAVNEGGDHIIRLWLRNGTSYTLIAGPYTWNIPTGTPGWREYSLPVPANLNAGAVYVISVSNSTDRNYAKRENLVPASVNDNIAYVSGVYTRTLGRAPNQSYAGSAYFRDLVFVPEVVSGNIPPVISAPATNQNVTEETNLLFNAANNNLISISDVDNTSGTVSVNSTQGTFTLSGITGLTFSAGDGTNDASMTFSGLLNSVNNALSSSYFMPVANYTGDASVTVTANDNVGGNTTRIISISVSNNGIPPDTAAKSNKALVLVNSGSAYYVHFLNYIRPYLDNFGIAYQIIDVTLGNVPSFNNYGLVIFGHNRVFESGYPVTELEIALTAGIGLYSFDSHLFDFSSGFNAPGPQESGSCSQLIIVQSNPHYIIEKHSDSQYDHNTSFSLLSSMSLGQNGSLVNGTVLAEGQVSGSNITLLEVTGYGSGKVVRWNSYEWMFDQYLGPLYGLDDLIWRGIVWAARKPFIMMGMPPMITMRVDDVDGTGGYSADFNWVGVSNNYGLRPWLGVFNNSIPSASVPTLKSYIDNGLATASPHSFTVDDFIYFNHNGVSNFNPVTNCTVARDFFIQHQLTMSKYILPHYYEMSPLCGPSIASMGGEFIGIHMIPGSSYETSSWLNRGPYRINRFGLADTRTPVYYADTIIIGGSTFFNCLTEIRDDGGYEWYPRNDQVGSTVARGVRHLRRAINSMVLASLFTHENYIDQISPVNWNTMMQQVTANMASYNPVYTTMDYALQYVRAKKAVTLLDVIYRQGSTQISYFAGNDMITQCYYFTETAGMISFRLIDIPQYNGINSITVTQ